MIQQKGMRTDEVRLRRLLERENRDALRKKGGKHLVRAL